MTSDSNPGELCTTVKQMSEVTTEKDSRETATEE